MAESFVEGGRGSFLSACARSAIPGGADCESVSVGGGGAVGGALCGKLRGGIYQAIAGDV